MRRLKMYLRWVLTVSAVVALTACGSDQIENEDVLKEIDPPQQIEYIDEEEEMDVEVAADNEDIGDSVSDMDGDGVADEGEVADEKGGLTSETAIHELYLVDSNGFVAPQSVNISHENNELESMIEYLVKGGPVTESLPNGFQAVLPSGTEVLNSEISNGVATIDFSEHFGEYHPDQELQVIEALTWTLTQLDGVDRVKLKMNGESLDVMPQNGTPIATGYTRNHGINLEMNDIEDITNTTSAIVYFISQQEDISYYVPVTRRIPNNENKYEAVVHELVEGPSVMTPLLTSLREEVELLDEPEFSEGTVTLNFNEALLSMMDGTAVSEDVLNMLVLSLTEQKEVEQVALQVQSNDSILVSSGENLTEPVTRPKMVNTGEY